MRFGRVSSPQACAGRSPRPSAELWGSVDLLSFCSFLSIAYFSSLVLLPPAPLELL